MEFLAERQLIFFFVPYTLSFVVLPTRKVTVFLFSRIVGAWEYGISIKIAETIRQRASTIDNFFFIILLSFLTFSDTTFSAIVLLYINPKKSARITPCELTENSVAQSGFLCYINYGVVTHESR